MEPRAGAKGNAAWQSTFRTQSRACVSLRWVTYEQAAHLRLARHTAEVGAGCGKAARPVLCGGRIAICVPTAIQITKSPPLTSRVFLSPTSLAQAGPKRATGQLPR
jgi:hypothetical protein